MQVEVENPGTPSHAIVGFPIQGTSVRVRLPANPGGGVKRARSMETRIVAALR